MRKIDEIDLKILGELQQDGSLSIDSLAERVHLSRNACWRRLKALEEHGAIKNRVALVDAEQVDVLASPTTGYGATPFSGGGTEALSIKTLHTPAWNSTGWPALSVPMGFDPDGLPLGLQIIGRPFADDLVLAVGHAYQELTDWHLRMPPASLDDASRAHV